MNSYCRNEQQKPLANVMTDIYNAGVYGQSITHLVDNVICPATQLLELKSKALSQEVMLPCNIRIRSNDQYS